MKKIIFDTAGFLAGLQNLFPQVYTTPLVLDEVKDLRSSNLLRLSMESGKIVVVMPSSSTLAQVTSTISRVKEKGLSQTDISVIALAYDLRPSIVFTDDLGVQNVLLHLGIEFNSVKLSFKLRNKKTAKYKCTACGRIFNTCYIECPYCGHKIVMIREK
ncbi:NOB1 family endonuclease [Stygiolobus caldivivus]|uniref:PIN domain-containing protein n=1 Tax=Stygiolobus caldivivus TaxID=2824673 RepID=A0A8D5U554_9CREN|nr:NOB1 family endonuclease [Stygiolobus caldivivus]BCU69260.1 hypothetical protein KN1_05570 [Stygiolobus caldivivus]